MKTLHWFLPALALAAVTSAWAAEEPSWTVEKVGNSAEGNRTTAIGLTSDGRVHAVYTGCSDAPCKYNELFYSVRDTAGSWTTKAIDSDQFNTGWFAAMEVDSHDVLHVAYSTHYKLPMLRYATLAPGKDWTFETLGKYAGGYWPSLRVSGEDLYLSHTAFPTNNVNTSVLEVDTLTRGSWKQEQIDTAFDAGWFTAMTLDNQGLPVISYVQNGYPDGDLKIARKTADGKWEFTKIDDQSIKSAVAVDAQGYMHVAYTKIDEMYMTTKDLFYATNAPDGKWRQKRLDGGQFEKATTGFFPKILIDKLGGIHIVYSDDFHKKMLYARNLSGKADGWELSNITHNLDDCYYASLAEDVAGTLHVVCDTGNEIHYARCENCTLH